jgi:poly-gamma-glutamate synthesis protein (capsule biosynthesis protein)
MTKKIKIILGLGSGLLFLVLLLLLKTKTNDILSPKETFSRNFPTPTIENRTAVKKTEIIITGDIMLGRSVMSTSLAKKDFNYPFLKTADVLKGADITFGNLENPIIKDCPFNNDSFIFCADPEMIDGLTFAGIDIVNLANNHTKNYGNDGLIQTQNYLDKEKIDYVGLQNLVIKNINKTKFGFLGFDFTANKPKESDYKLIKESKKKVDVLIVMTHWGIEYTSQPTEIQKITAKKIIESGADVIAGTHPHWIQSTEYIDGKPVFYSLGNFIFDQSWSEETKKGLVIRLNYQDKKLLKIDEMPIYMENFGQSKWIETTEK